MGKKTAVVLIHGIGEQVPMGTIKGFVEAVWNEDTSLVGKDKPNPEGEQQPADIPDEGGSGEGPAENETRRKNVSWVKPDPRYRNFDLNRITTESTSLGRRIDFFEYYWAHRTSGSAWTNVRMWLFDLLLRNPRKMAKGKRVPPHLRPTWLALWFVTLVIAAIAAGAAWLSAWPKESPYFWIVALILAAIAAVSAAITAKVTAYAGDIVRYVKATPSNIITRQRIREDGVRLLESLMGLSGEAAETKPDYDRLIVVGHSLGTIIAYDIISHCFARHHNELAGKTSQDTRQPQRAALEKLIRDGWCEGQSEDWLHRYRAAQDEARIEMLDNGGRWIVSDFISLGSPLTHAEFLLAEDLEGLGKAKQDREFPTCPPAMEYDQQTKDAHYHFSYRPPSLEKFGENDDAAAPRFPHHAAAFAFTKWTNIYSGQTSVVRGDLVSGRLDTVFGLSGEGERADLFGIEDIGVLPAEHVIDEDLTALTDGDRKKRLFTHLHYWDLMAGMPGFDGKVPHHIRRLRKALRLGEGQRPKTRAASASGA